MPTTEELYDLTSSTEQQLQERYQYNEIVPVQPENALNGITIQAYNTVQNAERRVAYSGKDPEQDKVAYRVDCYFGVSHSLHSSTATTKITVLFCGDGSPVKSLRMPGRGTDRPGNPWEQLHHGANTPIKHLVTALYKKC